LLLKEMKQPINKYHCFRAPAVSVAVNQ